MANPRGNIATLKPFSGSWNSGETKVIRVPIALADRVLAYARALDAGDVASDRNGLRPDDYQTLLQVIEGLRAVHGFPRNNFSRDRKEFLRSLIDQLQGLVPDADVSGATPKVVTVPSVKQAE